MNSPHKGQWRGALMFSLNCAWINGWVNYREAGDLRRHRTDNDVTVMNIQFGSTIEDPLFKFRDPLTTLPIDVLQPNEANPLAASCCLQRICLTWSILKFSNTFCWSFAIIGIVGKIPLRFMPLQWRHNGRDGVSNRQLHDCLLNRLLCVYQRKHRSSASLAVVRRIHRWLVNSPHKWPVTRKMFPFDDVIMLYMHGFHNVIWVFVFIQTLQ